MLGATHVPELELGQPLRYELRVANRGTEPARLGTFESPHGCTAELGATVIDPARDTTLRVICTPQTFGKFQADATLAANTPEPLALNLTATVAPLLAFESPTVDLTTPFGAAVTRDASIVGTRTKSAELRLAPFDSPNVRAELLPAASGAAPRVRLHLDGKQVGTHVGQISVLTNLEKPKELTLHYRTQVNGTLSIDPTNPYFNLRFEGGRRQVITVTSEQKEFRVHDARIVEGPFRAELRPKPNTPQSYEVDVHVDLAKITPELRGVSGRLVVRSNDRTEPTREIRLFALGKPGAGDPR